MRIGIDARFYGPHGKGLGRYTQKLLENLEKIDQKNEYFVLLRKENFDEYQPKNANFQKILADFRWYSISEQVRMPMLLNKLELDLVHFLHFNVPVFYRKKFVITIHDLILIHFPTLKASTLGPAWYWLKFLAYKTVIRSAVKRSQKIIAVSEFTKNDIIKHYKISEEKIAVTREACDQGENVSEIEPGKVLAKYGIIKPCILYVGNAYPHKNLEALVLAFGKLNMPKYNFQLALVGKMDYFYERLRKFTREQKVEDVVFTGHLPDQELDVLYHNARLYVFPSLYEGFGLPPLEAMAKGVPVASSDHPCMREILGESAYYFNARDIADISRAMEKMLQSEEIRKKYSRLGLEQVKKYSWEKMARETAEIYKNIKE